MSEPSTALRLADALRNIAADTSLSDRYCEVIFEVDDELRRLHSVNAELIAALDNIETSTYEAMTAALARAAIARAEEKV